MAGKKLTELSSSIAPSMTGVTAVAYGGITYKSTLSTLRQVLVDSGSHRFTGSQFISGSLTLTGSMPNLTVGSGTYHVDNPEILHVQNSGSYNIAHFEANNQYYAQVNIKNTNSGNTDLIINFRVHPHPKWQRNGLTLIAEQPVSIWDCLVGGETIVKDVLNNQYTISVPPLTQPGSLLRLKDKGLRNRQGQSGDLLIRIQANMPESISQELSELIKEQQKK
jgi:hypothetical protein